MSKFAESDVEEAALAWLEASGWSVLHGPDIAPGEVCAERVDYGQVVLEGRLRAALQRLNPELPAEALEEAFRKTLRPVGAGCGGAEPGGAPPPGGWRDGGVPLG